MKRVVHKAKDFDDALIYDILQQIGMTPAEWQRIAKVLKNRVYGVNPPDVRSHRKCSRIELKKY